MEQSIIKRLRVKFIAINMTLAFLVLLVTFGTVCGLNHINSVNAINSHLSYVLMRAASSETHPSDQVESVQPLERPDMVRTDIPINEGLSSLGNTSTVSPLADSPGSGDSTSAASDEEVANGSRSVSKLADEGVEGEGAAGSESAEGEGDDAVIAAASEGSGASVPAWSGADPSEETTENATGNQAGSPTGNTADNAADNTTPSSVTVDNKPVVAPVIGSGQTSSTILTAVFKVEENGIYTTVPAYTSATMPESVLLRADEAVINSSTARGYLSEFDLMYEKLKVEDGWFVAYANASSTHSWHNLAILLCIVGLIALIVFFLINIAFSRWATRPVAMSIRLQKQFTADASHELKTPLTVILANLSILRSHADSTVAEQMQWVESSEREAHRMQLLVNDMLSLARSQTSKEAAKEPLVPMDPVDMSDLVEGEVLQFESVAFERGILIESRIQEHVLVVGDAEKLGRMVSTLIDNACKYVESNGLVDVTLDVDASNAVADPVMRLQVHNTGEPIPPDQLEHLFDRFYRADKARTGGKGGYGLGLAIGQQIANEHNGAITVTSTAETGTTFIVTLPLYDE